MQVPGAAELPEWPGVSFAPVALVAGQTARLKALNPGPNTPEPGDGGPQGALPAGECAGGVGFAFYSADGQVLKKKSIPNLLPGTSASLELSSDELPKNARRTEIRAVLKYGFAGGASPPKQIMQRLECNIHASLEIVDKATGKTSLILTDTKPLPGPTNPLP